MDLRWFEIVACKMSIHQSMRIRSISASRNQIWKPTLFTLFLLLQRFMQQLSVLSNVKFILRRYVRTNSVSLKCTTTEPAQFQCHKISSNLNHDGSCEDNSQKDNNANNSQSYEGIVWETYKKNCQAGQRMNISSKITFENFDFLVCPIWRMTSCSSLACIQEDVEGHMRTGTVLLPNSTSRVQLIAFQCNAKTTKSYYWFMVISYS